MEYNRLPPSLTMLSSLEHLELTMALNDVPALPASLTWLRLGNNTPLPAPAQVRRVVASWSLAMVAVL